MRAEDQMHEDYKPDPFQMAGRGWAGCKLTEGQQNWYDHACGGMGIGPYDNQSLNVKLATAKEWLKSREKKCSHT